VGKLTELKKLKQAYLQVMFPQVGEVVPRLRFKGFTNAWEQRRLRDVAEIIDGDRGKNYPNGDDFHKQGHTLFLSATNVTKNGFSFASNQYISEEKSNQLGNGKLQLNDIVLTSRGSLGHVAWYNDEIFKQMPFLRINSGMLILRSNDDVAPNFIEQLLKSPFGEKQIDSISFGSAQPQLTKKDITNFAIALPKLPEQAAIGTFFRTLDNTIAIHKRKLNSLRELKKAYLQVMFPQDGETEPRLRFAGFGESWKLRKLGELSIIKTGSSDVQDSVPDGEYPFFVRSEKIERSNRFLFDGEAILIPGEGRLGEIYHYINGKFDYHQRVYKISNFSGETYGLFLLYTMQKTFKQHAMTYTVKATVDSLRLPMLTDYAVLLPSIDEQITIGKFFRTIDELIKLYS